MDRRHLLTSLAFAPLAVSLHDVSSGDAELVALGNEYLQIARELDTLEIPFEGHVGRVGELLARVEQIDAAIHDMRATSLPALKIRAEIAKWARNGDFKPITLCLDERMAWAIVRDLCAMNSDSIFHR
jgi:hypothetical protein